MEINGKPTKLKKQVSRSGVIAMTTVGTEEIGASKDDVDEI